MIYFGYFSFSIIHLEFKIQIQPHPISDQTGQNLYMFSDQNGSKPYPLGVAHTYIAYIGENLSPGACCYALLAHLQRMKTKPV